MTSDECGAQMGQQQLSQARLQSQNTLPLNNQQPQLAQHTRKRMVYQDRLPESADHHDNSSDLLNIISFRAKMVHDILSVAIKTPTVSHVTSLSIYQECIAIHRAVESLLHVHAPVSMTAVSQTPLHILKQRAQALAEEK